MRYEFAARRAWQFFEIVNQDISRGWSRIARPRSFIFNPMKL
jgi:hypothetical protein